MVSFLFTISFLIHLITFFVIIILYQKMNTINDQDPNEFEQMFQHYLNEIREENRHLQQELEQRPRVNNKNVKNENPQYKPIMETEFEVEDEVETSLTANILSLAKKGYNSNEIAQELKCGKTEAELIIKFHEGKSP